MAVTSGPQATVICDTEAERQTSWEGYIIYCKDTNKTYIVESGAYVEIGGAGGAPTTVEYLVGALDGSLSNERMVTDTTTMVWDLGTVGQAKVDFAPTADVDFLSQQATNFRVENRTSDPGAPSAGQVWLRTDL